MDILMFLLMITAFILIFIYLFKSIKYKDKKYLKKSGLSVLGMIVFFILFSMSIDATDDVASNQSNDSVEAEDEEVLDSEVEDTELTDSEEIEEENDPEDIAEEDESYTVWEDEEFMAEREELREKTNWRTDITWREMARNPDDYLDEDIQIELEVMRVFEDEYSTYIQGWKDGEIDEIMVVEYNQEK